MDLGLLFLGNSKYCSTLLMLHDALLDLCDILITFCIANALLCSGITMRLACEAFTITFIAAQFWLFHVRKYPVWLTYVHSTFLVLAPILLDRYSGMESPSWAYLKHLWTMRVNGGGDCAGVVWLNLD